MDVTARDIRQSQNGAILKCKTDRIIRNVCVKPISWKVFTTVNKTARNVLQQNDKSILKEYNKKENETLKMKTYTLYYFSEITYIYN